MPNRSLVFVVLVGLLLTLPASAQRMLEGPQRIPGLDAELFGLDRAHSTLDFSIEFLGMTRVRGTFNVYSAAILYDEEDMTNTSVTLVVDVSSIDTDNGWRDKDLRSERFFHAEAYPYIVFRSERVERAEAGYVAYGPLTVRGVTKQIAVPFHHTLPRTVDDVWGNVRIGVAGQVTLNRKDFDVNGGDFWGVGVLGEEVQIDFALLGTRSNVEKWSYNSREQPSIGEVLEATYTASGLEAALQQYHNLKASDPEDYNFDQGQLNLLGYRLLQRGHLEDAAAIFKLNADAYPESGNVYDSLGEAYALLGWKEQALESYKKALTKNPHLPSAMEMTRRLRPDG